MRVGSMEQQLRLLGRRASCSLPSRSHPRPPLPAGCRPAGAASAPRKRSSPPHAGTPLFALDIHPSGGKLATCGSDQTVKVWSTAPILHERQELDERTPKLLATLSDHCGAVNTVQFSRSGKYIASGSGGSRRPPASGGVPGCAGRQHLCCCRECQAG
jgi:hypothetical protein